MEPAKRLAIQGMRKLAAWFHTRFSGGDFPEHPEAKIDPIRGIYLFTEQINAVNKSGLYDSLDEFYVGLNGSVSEGVWANEIVPRGTKVLTWLPPSRSLIPTMRHLQNWLPGHEEYLCCFFHAKGATHDPRDPLTTMWRHCMEQSVIWNWRRCVNDLESGQYDAVGVHWCHNSTNDPNADRWGGNSYFGGVYWWATAKYLLTLPKLPMEATDRHSFYLPELWIGCGKPRIKDYHPGPVTNH
jgi:hypothetical protein